MKSGPSSDPPDDLARLHESPRFVASWQNAQQHIVNNRFGPALTVYRSLVQQFPRVAQLWAELSIAAAGELDFPLAAQAARRAEELAGNDSPLLLSIGQQFYRLRQPDNAGASFERAVAADPASISARLRYAEWLERNRQWDKAWECIDAALAAQANNPQALYFEAFLLHRKGRNSEAETVLRDLLKTTPAYPDAAHLLGVVLDALGQYEEALRCLEQAKAQRRQSVDAAAMERNYERKDRARRELLGKLTPEIIQRWREEAGPDAGGAQLAFLGGAPRSGTTLIEQILGAHPDISVFDEPEGFVQEIAGRVDPPPPGKDLTVKSLNALTTAERARLTARYFKSVAREMPEPAAGKRWLDKNPALTAALHIWLRFFPASKIIIALRDPRDNIVSCYFQNFSLTTANVNFLSLEGTARYYGDCMDVWLRLRELGGFDWLETRYEDVVGNLEAEGRRATSFLGLGWRESQAKYYETAREKYVFAPTYEDVTKPVYQRAIGRWKHYTEALAPLQERVAKYCQAFGYR